MEHKSELLRLLAALCDDQITVEEQARLEALLLDADVRRLYLQYVDMHARMLTHPALGGERKLTGVDALAGMLGESAVRAGEQQSPAAAIPRSPWHKLHHAASYAAVALVTIAATILVQLAMPRPQAPEPSGQPTVLPLTYVATLAQASDVEWGPATQAYRAGSRLLAGELELRHGIARLGYDGGVEIIVEGPARLRLESGSNATLLAGKVVFRADDAAAPFTLSTPSSVLVDQGTEYAVEVGAQQEEVHVFDGEVQRVPKAGIQPPHPQLLAAGEARRYGGSLAQGGEPAQIEPTKFVRQLPAGLVGADPARDVLAYEGFDYSDPAALRESTANGGSGFMESWGGGFARLPNDKRGDQIALNVNESLVRDGANGAAVGGSFDHTGFAKYFRRLQTPIRLDTDGVYYFSYLVRRAGPPLDPLNSVSIQLRQTEELQRDQLDATADLSKRLNFGVDRTNELFTHLERIGRRMPLPLSYGETYLLVAKVAASGPYPDQVFLRVYGPQEPVDSEEPANWSAVGSPVHSDLIFDWLEIHINSHTRQTIDEIRLGTTWESVAAPWVSDG